MQPERTARSEHVMSGVNPQGCQVFSFKHPSATELQHDFLWRQTRDLPERGQIGIFNRSYYEEVLIVRVHRDILTTEGLPTHPKMTKSSGNSRSALSQTSNGTSTKWNAHHQFFLHLSKDEQRNVPCPH